MTITAREIPINHFGERTRPHGANPRGLPLLRFGSIDDMLSKVPSAFCRYHQRLDSCARNLETTVGVSRGRFCQVDFCQEKSTLKTACESYSHCGFALIYARQLDRV